jgi:hypothetical protein
MVIVANDSHQGAVDMQTTTIGLDIAKNVFQVHGIDASEKVVVRKQLRRGQMLAFFEALLPLLVGMEACATVHYWARELRSRTARVMTTLMRNGRDRRSENPSGPTRYLSACCCPGPISGSHQGQQPLRLHRDRGNPPSENRPYTRLHPNASQKVKFAPAPRAPSIHGP